MASGQQGKGIRMNHQDTYQGKRIVVTGGAGFIGSHAVDALVASGAQVTVLDDLSTGKKEFLSNSIEAVELVVGDVRDEAKLDACLAGADAVWHLAANPEVRTGATDPSSHYALNVDATYRVLEGVRRHDVPALGFTSTSTVYGPAAVMPTPEDYGPLLPISIYGGAKLACEALVASYATTFGFKASLWRFANVVGARSNHGVTFDFVHKLLADGTRLQMLGDGTQCKSYVSIEDTVAAMLHSFAVQRDPVAPWNIGSDDAIPVREIAEIVAEVLQLQPVIATQGGTADGAGWVGDVKHMRLDTSKLQATGWKASHPSSEAIRRTARAVLSEARSTSTA